MCVRACVRALDQRGLKTTTFSFVEPLLASLLSLWCIFVYTACTCVYVCVCTCVCVCMCEFVAHNTLYYVILVVFGACQLPGMATYLKTCRKNNCEQKNALSNESGWRKQTRLILLFDIDESPLFDSYASRATLVYLWLKQRCLKVEHFLIRHTGSRRC